VADAPERRQAVGLRVVAKLGGGDGGIVAEPFRPIGPASRFGQHFILFGAQMQFEQRPP
jgi:hypothetical protein